MRFFPGISKYTVHIEKAPACYSFSGYVNNKRTSRNTSALRQRRNKELSTQSTPLSSGRKFLYNSEGLDVISLLENVLLAHINNAIKLLKFKSVVNISNGRLNRESATE